MTYEDEERIERHLFSVSYRATASEARGVYLRLSRTQDWVAWSYLDDFVKYCPAVSGLSADDFLSKCKLLAEAYAKMTVLAEQAIVAMEARR